jgi:hypothetical protein
LGRGSTPMNRVHCCSDAFMSPPVDCVLSWLIPTSPIRTGPKGSHRPLVPGATRYSRSCPMLPPLATPKQQPDWDSWWPRLSGPTTSIQLAIQQLVQQQYARTGCLKKPIRTPHHINSFPPDIQPLAKSTLLFSSTTSSAPGRPLSTPSSLCMPSLIMNTTWWPLWLISARMRTREDWKRWLLNLAVGSASWRSQVVAFTCPMTCQQGSCHCRAVSCPR